MQEAFTNQSLRTEGLEMAVGTLNSTANQQATAVQVRKTISWRLNLNFWSTYFYVWTAIADNCHSTRVRTEQPGRRHSGCLQFVWLICQLRAYLSWSTQQLRDNFNGNVSFFTTQTDFYISEFRVCKKQSLEHAVKYWMNAPSPERSIRRVYSLVSTVNSAGMGPYVPYFTVFIQTWFTFYHFVRRGWRRLRTHWILQWTSKQQTCRLRKATLWTWNLELAHKVLCVNSNCRQLSLNRGQNRTTEMQIFRLSTTL